MSQDVGVRILVEDINVVNGFDTVISKANELKKVQDEAHKEKMRQIQEMHKSQDDANKAKLNQDSQAVKSQKLVGESFKESMMKIKRNVQAQQDYDKALKNTIANHKVFGVSLNDIKGKVEGLIDNIKGAKSAIIEKTSITRFLKNAYESTGASVTTLTDRYKSLKTKLVSVRDSFKNTSTLSKIVSGSLKGVSLGAGLVTKSLKLMRIAIVSTGIGALVVALGSLVSFLSTTQRGSEVLSKVWTSLGIITEKFTDKINVLGEAIFDAIKNPEEAISKLGELIKNNLIVRFESLGKVISSVLKGEWTAAGKAAVDAMTGVENSFDRGAKAAGGFANEVQDAVDAAKALENQKKALREAEIELTKSFRQTRSEIKALNKEAEDTNNSIDVRKQKSKEAYELEQKLLKDRLKVAEQNLTLIREENKLLSDEDKLDGKEREAEAEARLYEIREESLEQQTTLGNKLNALNKEQQDKLQALSDKYKELNNDLIGQLTDLQLKEADPITRINIQREIALKALEEQKALLIEAAQAMGKPIKDLEDGFDKLINAANRDFDRQIDQVEVDVIPTLKDGSVASLTAKSNAPLKAPITPVVDQEEFKNELEGVAEQIQEFFKNEKVKKFLSGAKEAFDQFAGLFTEYTRGQIEEIDKVSEKRKEDIESLEEEIEEAEELRAQGFDVNVSQKQAQLEALRAKEEEDQKKRAELQARAQKVQILSDSITQASSLVTASSKIYAGFASIPIAGPILAAAAIAAMFSFFAKTKVDALKATKLYTGADSLFEGIGQLAPGESSDVPGRGEGFSVIDSSGKLRAKLGGEEMIVDGVTTNSHGEVMRWVRDNRNYYTSMEMLSRLGGHNPNIAILESDIRTAKSQSDSAYEQRQVDATAKASAHMMRGLLLEQNSDLLYRYNKLKNKKTSYTDERGRVVKVERM